MNAKLPYVYNTGSTATLIPTGPNAQLLTVSANGSGIGDVQLGTSYQINSGENGWPIFVGNFLLKTATGTSPFDVPILTQDQQPAGPFLAGTPLKLATGTGFYALEPSLTVLMPTAPGVLFANLLFIHNIGRTQNIQSAQGGPPTPVKLQPGEAPAITFGIGFSLNDRAAMTFSYQQEHVFTAFANGQAIRGSPYSFGNFNFGLGYQLSQSTRVNLSVGIGVGPNTPVAKIPRSRCRINSRCNGGGRYRFRTGSRLFAAADRGRRRAVRHRRQLRHRLHLVPERHRRMTGLRAGNGGRPQTGAVLVRHRDIGQYRDTGEQRCDPRRVRRPRQFRRAATGRHDAEPEGQRQRSENMGHRSSSDRDEAFLCLTHRKSPNDSRRASGQACSSDQEPPQWNPVAGTSRFITAVDTL